MASYFAPHGHYAADSHFFDSSSGPALPALPVTGDNTIVIAGIGVLIAGLGVALFMRARRRRDVTFVA